MAQKKTKTRPRRKPRHTPEFAALEVTLRCDMTCLHCGSAATRRERPGSLSHEEWLGVVDELKRLGTRHFTLSGGEPFLYPRWRELVTYIRDRGGAVNFISNGHRITEDDVVFMKQVGVEHLGVSLDGDEAVHDAIRRTPGSFRRIVDLFALGRKHGLPVYPASSINKMNFPVREDILRVLLENGVKFWQVQIVNSFGRADKLRDRLLLEPDQFVTLCEDIRRWQHEHGEQVRVIPADSLGYCHPVTDEILGDYRWEGCNAGMHVIGIQADGAVLGCLSLQAERFVAGNIRERPLSEIWQDDTCFAYTRLYDPSLMEGACGGCDSARQCKAGCLGLAYSVTGTITQNPYCYKSIISAAEASHGS